MRRPERQRVEWIDVGDGIRSFRPTGTHVDIADRDFRPLPGLREALPRMGYWPVERMVETRSTWYCRGRLRWLFWRGLLGAENGFWSIFYWAYDHRLIHVAVGEAEMCRWRDIRPGPWYADMKGGGA